MKITKKRKVALDAYDATKSYTLLEAADIIKKISSTKFDSSFDIDVRLGVDPRQANQMVRGVASLTHGLGKTVRVLALVTPDKEEEARAAGADHVGLDDYIEKISSGWTDIDIIVAVPAVMAKIGRLGKILGPRNLMPNPKSGTVTTEVGKAVTEVKAGKIDFKVDKTGIIHASVGKVTFDSQMLSENAIELVQVLHKLKPSAAKGTYFKSIFVSSTMSPSVSIDIKSIPGI